jgi:predicted nucleotidyltransferase
MPVFDTLRGALHAMPSVRLAVVFGSEARGTAGPSSDVDLGVVLEGNADPGQLGVELERLLHRTVHVVLLDQSPPLLRSEISRAGKVLVERTPHAWADFRARAMIDWWDWEPTARMVQRTVAERLREEAGRGSS